MDNDTVDKHIDDEPVFPQKVAPDQTKDNALVKMNSETACF